MSEPGAGGQGGTSDRRRRGGGVQQQRDGQGHSGAQQQQQLQQEVGQHEPRELRHVQQRPQQQHVRGGVVPAGLGQAAREDCQAAGRRRGRPVPRRAAVPPLDRRQAARRFRRQELSARFLRRPRGPKAVPGLYTCHCTKAATKGTKQYTGSGFFILNRIPPPPVLEKIRFLFHSLAGDTTSRNIISHFYTVTSYDCVL